MKIIVGLGNPGRQYKKTRHNIGFFAIDALADAFGIEVTKRKFNAYYGSGVCGDASIVLVKPQTYMNRSGFSVNHFARYFSITAADDLLIIVDDIHLSLGKMRIRKKGSAGGHNGIQSVIDEVGTQDFSRMRIGIGKPAEEADLTAHVLGMFSKAEYESVHESMIRATEAVMHWIQHGPENAAQLFNSQRDT